MKVLHAALMSQRLSGVFQQMSWEQDAAERLGLPWESRVFIPNSLEVPDERIAVRATEGDDFLAGGKTAIGSAVRWRAWRLAFYDWLQERARGDVDLIVLRYAPNDPFRARATRNLDAAVVSLHHTLELEEMKLNGARVRVLAERRWGNRALRSADHIAGVTREIADYELRRCRRVKDEAFIYPNGADMTNAPHGVVPRASVPEIVFVADNFQPWQGLDRLLTNLPETAFHLHLVGELPLSLRDMAHDSRIKCWGRLPRRELEQLLGSASVGLSSFALDRKNMREACTLKVREYLSSGLAVYSGHADVFPDDFNYYRSGAADMSAVVSFARQVAGVERSRIAEASAPYISKDILLANFYSTLIARRREVYGTPA